MFDFCVTILFHYTKAEGEEREEEKKKRKKNGPGLCCVTTRICDVVARTQGGLGKGKAVTDREKKVPPRSHSQNK